MTEQDILKKIFRLLPGTDGGEIAVPPGDDCAAIRQADGLLLLAVDQLIGGCHYTETGDQAPTPWQIGRKLLARNLSDIAAMGGIPRFCLVASSIRDEHNERWLETFMRGISELGQEFGVDVIGGDLGRTQGEDIHSLTIVGRMSEEYICRRSGATAGDRIFVTGCLGDAVSTGHHLNFSPRCKEGQWLAESKGVTAMIDISDGLSIDLERICRSSTVDAWLDAGALPLRNEDTTLKSALQEGEDYELLFAVSPSCAQTIRSEWPFADVPVTEIGVFRQTASPEAPTVHFCGEQEDTSDEYIRGWDHFRNN